jgi:hypothetical protein
MSLLERELAGLPDARQRILLVVGNYDEAALVAEALAGALGTAPGEDVVALVPNAEGELESTRVPGTLPRGLLAEFPMRTARFLVAPLQAVERGHNILVGQIAAIGSVYFLVRPYPVPGDPYTAIQKMNAWATGYVPTLIGMDPGTAGMTLRQEARPRWDYALADEDTYSGAPDRTGLLWTQLVLVWQCIGRLLRGGVKARVHFIDAKWAEVYTGLRSGDSDTEATSMLIGFARILQEAFTDPNPVHRAIAQELYGPFAQALARLALKGMPHD